MQIVGEIFPNTETKLFLKASKGEIFVDATKELFQFPFQTHNWL
jgi:hypothetical protein